LTAAAVAIGVVQCLPVNRGISDALAAATSVWTLGTQDSIRDGRIAGTHLPLAHIKGVAIQLALRVELADFVRGRDVVSQVHVLRKGCPS
jgi:hypothetical protein